MTAPDPAAIRAVMEEKDTLRARDLALTLGISEGQLVAATVGFGARRITADPDRLIAGVCELGEVMALTRNESAVHERTGAYQDWHSGNHAAMVLGDEIDLRIFPKHWVHGFATRREDAAKGPSRSLQVFDDHGEAVHKIYPRDGTDLRAWDRLVDALATAETSDQLSITPPSPPEGSRIVPEKADLLRREWQRMTDTHQFLRLVAKFKMNRLGAYRLVGLPFAQQLGRKAIDDVLQAVARKGVPIMLFVGNRGCIQIHSGPIETLKPMGPWQNVLDPRFNLHLRLDHIAEAWLVQKPTKRGMALSVEAFDADGRLILQVFGMRKAGADYSAAFAEVAETLPVLEAAE